MRCLSPTEYIRVPYVSIEPAEWTIEGNATILYYKLYKKVCKHEKSFIYKIASRLFKNIFVDQTKYNSNISYFNIYLLKTWKKPSSLLPTHSQHNIKKIKPSPDVPRIIYYRKHKDTLPTGTRASAQFHTSYTWEHIFLFIFINCLLTSLLHYIYRSRRIKTFSKHLAH